LFRSLWLGTAASAAAVLLLFLCYLLFRNPATPEERERRRRAAVNAAGRITDGFITEVEVFDTPGGATVHVLHFSYTLNGVTYSAAQDITSLLAYIDRDPQRLAGPVGVKYLPGNPSNSIVICEGWSGIR
jgi:hypothetical protein